MKLMMMVMVYLIMVSRGHSVDIVNYDERYFTISDIKIEEVKGVVNKNIEVPAPGELPKPGDLPPVPQLPEPPKPDTTPANNGGSTNFPEAVNNVNLVLDTIDKIVNLAEKVLGIIEKNQPVVDINVNYANAVPYGIQHWTQLQGWSRPKTKTYEFVAKNLYGVNVVKVRYQLQFRHNGNYQGKGKFLTGVTIEPISVETAWGYKVSLTAEVPDSTIANVGTHEDPIASMQVQLKWKIHTVLKDVQQKVIYYVQGDGKFGEVASPFKNATIERSKKVDIEIPIEDDVSKKIKSIGF